MYRKTFTVSHPLGQITILLLFLVTVYLYLTLSGYQVGWNLITGRWLTHSSDPYCYSIQYPGRWKLHISGDGGWHGGVRPYQRAMLSQPKPYLFGGITFRIDQVPMNQPSLEDVAAWSLENWSKITQQVFPLTPLESVIVNEQPALIRTFSGGLTEVYIARESDGLILSMTTKANYHKDASEVFQQLLDEFSYWECHG